MIGVEGGDGRTGLSSWTGTTPYAEVGNLDLFSADSHNVVLDGVIVGFPTPDAATAGLGGAPILSAFEDA